MQEPFLHIILCNLQLAKINATVGMFFFLPSWEWDPLQREKTETKKEVWENCICDKTLWFS